MHFRIVGSHRHEAVVNGETFACIRESTLQDDVMIIRWSVVRNGVVLKADCRTLNEAKILCRAAIAPPGP